MDKKNKYDVTIHNPQVLCTCDTEVIKTTGQPTVTRDPKDCIIPPRIIFYLLWIEDDLGKLGSIF